MPKPIKRSQAPRAKKPRTIWLSNGKITATVRIGGTRVIGHEDTAPIFRKFIGQDWYRLVDWLRATRTGELRIACIKIGNEVVDEPHAKIHCPDSSSE
jgi:hypothetical protein